MLGGKGQAPRASESAQVDTTWRFGTSLVTPSPSFSNYNSKQCSFPRLPQHQGLGVRGVWGAPGRVTTHQYSYVCLNVSQLAGSAQEGPLFTYQLHGPTCPHTALRSRELQSKVSTLLLCRYPSCPLAAHPCSTGQSTLERAWESSSICCHWQKRQLWTVWTESPLPVH